MKKIFVKTQRGFFMKHLYNDESLIVRLKKKLAFFFFKRIQNFFQLIFFFIVKSFFDFFTENMNSYKALVITLHLCNSLRCKLTHMGFELELRFTYTCTMVGMFKFCPEIIRHFFLLNQQKSDSNRKNFYANTSFYHL